MLHYEHLSKDIEEKLRADIARRPLSPHATRDGEAHRRHEDGGSRADVWRAPFARDVDTILHCPFYSRYADKTQAFSLYRNDDLTRRALHVQLVSRIARTIGGALGLNLDLVEAIALGHDIGHTPFGHAGEAILDRLYFSHAGRHFAHNVHSVRVLDEIFPYNLTLETLAGIAGHNGEEEENEYRPHPLSGFAELDAMLEAACLDASALKKLRPSTLEGCVVRISDIIAYLGKDRQDAARAGGVGEGEFRATAIGRYNAEIIHNLIVNILECSYGHGAIRLDKEHFSALAEAKRENYERIYRADESAAAAAAVEPLMGEVYERLLDDLTAGREDSPIFTHH
ncbi:MAG: HD domain-containing protein, partial [Clostridia bacterium]|nr:HD domain-containing protein [Clostridia bacterium]